MEISIERSPQHWCPNEGSNSELFDHKNDTVIARPQLLLPRKFILLMFKTYGDN